MHTFVNTIATTDPQHFNHFLFGGPESELDGKRVLCRTAKRLATSIPTPPNRKMDSTSSNSGYGNIEYIDLFEKRATKIIIIRHFRARNKSINCNSIESI